MSDRPAILVTGGAGYIGSHSCRALHEAGFTPVCFDNLSTGHRQFAKWGPLVLGDIQDSGLVAETLKAYRAVAVMHFAAFSLVGEANSDPQKYYSNNVGGTLSLLRGMRDAGCSKLVFSSTGAVYGNASSEPIREDAPSNPLNTYGSTKWMIERVLADYGRAYDLKSICLRYFNASGADPSGEIGELHDPESHLIPRAIMAVQGYVNDFAVFGDDYDTPDGSAIRDYIHVSDLAQAHVLAIQSLLAGSNGGTFNLGTGHGYSVKEILSAISKVTGRRVPHVVKPRRAGDPAILVADADAARRVLKLAPRFSDIETIISTAWAWHEQVRLREPLKDTALVIDAP